MKKFQVSMRWVVAALAALLLPLTARAQDAYSIPGVDDSPGNGAAATASGSTGSGEDAAPEYANLLEKLIGLGGFFIWPLLVLSVALVGLTVFCAIDLSRRNFFPDRLVRALEESVDRADLRGALDRAEKSSTCLGQVMFGAAEYIGDRGYQTLDDNGLYDAMADASQEFNRGRARTINYFSVIAQSAPMIGLLGTVSGMIKAFDKLGQTGMGDPAQLASNISEALWTTASGLVIAVPALYLYFYFRDRLTALVSQTDRKAYRLLNRLRRAVVRQSSGGDGGPEPPPAVPPGGSPEPVPPSDPPQPLPQPLPQPE